MFKRHIVKNKISRAESLQLYLESEEHEALTTYRPLKKFMRKEPPINYLPPNRKHLQRI